MLGFQQLAIDQQPGGGTIYPFSSDAAKLSAWLLDAAISYRDDFHQFEPPFQLAWFYNRAARRGSVPVGFTPVHDVDCLITDAIGQTLLDTRQATDYQARPWGSDWVIITWRKGAKIIRLILATSLMASVRKYTQYVHEVFDLRIIDQEPPRVRSLTVEDVTIDHDNAILSGGYNMRLDQALQSSPGHRRQQLVTLNAIPGAGLGRYPGCQEPELAIRTINKIKPTTDGSFTLQTDSCFRITPAQQITSTSPRQAALIPATLQMSNDCKPCCECVDYANTYKAISNVWDRAHAANTAWTTVRNNYQTAVDRWSAQKLCREAQPLRLSVISTCPCQLQVGAMLCNTTNACLLNLELRLTLEILRGGVLQPHSGPVQGVLSCNSTILQVAGNQDLYSLGGGWPMYSVYLDSLDAGSTAKILTGFLFDNCEDIDAVRVTVTLHSPITIPVWEPIVPSDITALLALRAPLHSTSAILQVTRPLHPAVDSECPCE